MSSQDLEELTRLVIKRPFDDVAAARVRHLVAAGVPLDTGHPITGNKSAPTLALAIKNYDAFQVLLEKGVPAEEGKSLFGMVATDYSESSDDHRAAGLRVARLLVDAGAPVDGVYDGGNNLLHQCTDLGIAEVIYKAPGGSALLAQKNEDGKTPKEANPSIAEL